jgi:hypothetical protein
VLPGALGITMLEQASIELADVVVSPSRYVVDWMGEQGWELPADTRVIPHLTRFAATGEGQPRVEVETGPVRRIVFFGRLEERKGIVPFIEAVNALPVDLLERTDVEFIGRATRRGHRNVSAHCSPRTCEPRLRPTSTSRRRSSGSRAPGRSS